MGKKLAIRGHSTRGKEVIELLEMMGGKNIHNLYGNNSFEYYVSGHAILNDRLSIIEDDDFVIFNLEEFLEKYPFKVGDKVIDDYVFGDPLTIKSMSWSEELKTVLYAFEEFDAVLAAKDLKPIDAEFLVDREKSERTHEDVIFDSIIWHLRNSVNNGKQNLSGGECEDYFREVVKKNNKNKMKNVLAELLEHIKTTPKEELEREFEKIKEWSDVGPTVEEFKTFCECVNKKPVYPTTYEKCCEVLDYCGDYFLTTYDNNDNPSIISNILNSINILTKLLICRDAYWKIAGEEMGLGKPWEPDWNNERTFYCIFNSENKIVKNVIYSENKILAFPTEEMRDVFYDNFKDLIESCKELL